MHHHKQLLAFSSTNLFKISLFPKYLRAHNWTEKVIFLWNLSLIFMQVICFYSLFLKHQSQHLEFVLLCIVEIGDALRVMLLPYLLLLYCELLRLVWRWQEVYKGRYTICRNDQTWKQQKSNCFRSTQTMCSLKPQADDPTIEVMQLSPLTISNVKSNQAQLQVLLLNKRSTFRNH